MLSKLRKKTAALVLAAAMTTTLGTALPRPAEAFDTLSAILAGASVAVQWAQVNKQVNYLNGDGRMDYMQQVKNEKGVNDDYEANQMLARVMQRLSYTIAQEDDSITKQPYNYFVNNDDSFNAFCTLGHNLSVNIGLFRILNYNEDEIAFVVGHEMAHGQNNDPANGVKKQLPIQLLAAIAASQTGNSLQLLGTQLLASHATAKGVTLPMEKKADRMAFGYCSKSGYNVGAGAAVWQRIIEKYGAKKQDFASSVINPSDHPNNVSRRDLYSKDITEWSNDKVKVNKDNGMVSVGKKEIGIPAATSSMSSLERAYLVAGNLAGVYHETSRPRAAEVIGNTLYLGSKHIMTLAGDNGSAWAARLNAAR